jgi:predicted transcriptional regulator
MGVTKGRSRWEIILDVLKAIQENNKAKKTYIMQRAYLDWRNFERYFSFLLEKVLQNALQIHTTGSWKRAKDC